MISYSFYNYGFSNQSLEEISSLTTFMIKLTIEVVQRITFLISNKVYFLLHKINAKTGLPAMHDSYRK